MNAADVAALEAELAKLVHARAALADVGMAPPAELAGNIVAKELEVVAAKNAATSAATAKTTPVTATAVKKQAGRMQKKRKILHNNIQRITREHLDLLAARAGITAIGGLSYEELRGITKVFMENFVRETVTLTEHRRSKTVQLLNVLGGTQGSTLHGTGRFAEQLLRSIRPSIRPTSTAAADAQALFEAEAAVARKETAEELHGDGEDAGLIAEIAASVRDEQEAKEAARLEQDEDEDELTPRKRLLRGDPPVETDPCRCEVYALQLVRAMQTETKPVIPFMPFCRLTAEIGQDFKTDLDWAPELVCAFNAVVEHHLVGLLQHAHLSAIGRDMLAVQPRDLQLARRIRGDRN